MSAVVDFVSDVIDTVGSAVGDVIEGVGDAVSSVMDNVVAPVMDTVGNVIDSAMQDPIGTVAKVATAIVAPELLPLVSAADTVAHGGDLGDALQSAATTYVAQGVGSYVNSATDVAVANNFSPESVQTVTDSAGNVSSQIIKGSVADVAGNIAGGTAAGIVRGQDPLQALVSNGVSAGTSAIAAQIPGFSDLPPAAQRAVSNTVSAALNGKDPSQALINAAMSAGIAEAKAQYNAPPADMGMNQIGAASGTFTPSSTYGTEPDASSVQADSGALPSGIQVASTDSGLPKQEIVGMPIYADSSKANTVSPPFGYDLMPSSLNIGKPPAGAYYDPTQNAWFMPNQDAQKLQEQLANATTGGLPADTQATSSGALPTEDATQTQTDSTQTQADATQTPADTSTQVSGGLPTEVSFNQYVSQSVAGMTPDQVQAIVNNAMASNPSMTPDQVQQIVSDAIAKNPGITPTQVSDIVSQQVSSVQGGLSALGQTVAENQSQNLQNYLNLSAEQQKIAQDLINQGVSTSQAIAQAQEQSSQALKSGLDAVRTDLGQQIAGGLSGLSSDFQAKLAASDQATQDAFSKMSTAQQEEAAARVAQGESLQKSIGDVQSSLGQQITGGLSALSKDFQEKLASSDAATQDAFSKMTAAQQEEAAARVAQGDTLQKSITDVQSGLTQQIQSGLSGLSADFQNRLAQTDANTQAAFSQLSDAQKAQAEQLANTTGDLTKAISDVASSTSQQIQSGLSSLSQEFQDKLAASDAATQSGFASLTDAQKAEAQARVQQGQDLQSAISNVESGLGSKIESGLSGLATDFASQLQASNEATKAGFDQLTASQQAEVQARVDMGQSLQDAISASQASTSQQISGVQSSLEGQLNAQGKQFMDALQQQGVDYNTALQSAIDAQNQQFQTGQAQTQSQLTGLGEQIQGGLSGLQSQFESQLAASDAATQNRFNSLSDDQKALAASLASSTGNLQDAINQVSTQSQAGISGLGEQVTGLGGQLQSFQETTDQRIQDLMDQGLTQQEAIDQVNQDLTKMGQDLTTQITTGQEDTKKLIDDLTKTTTTNISNVAASTQSGLKNVQTQIADQAARAAAAQASKPLDSSPQLLKGAPVQQKNTARLAELKQLYNSLTPELKSALAPHGITEPQSTAMPMESDSTLSGFAEGGSSYQTSVDAMSPKWAPLAKAMLEAAPMVEHKSRLGALTHLSQGALKTAKPLGGLAQGGLPTKYAEAAPDGHKPEFITGLTGYYASGKGTGQSDDIPAMLHDGDYVIDAEAVSALGDGSSKAGAQALANFQKQVPHRDGGPVHGKPVPAKIADGEYVFPAAFVTALGGGDNKAGSRLLDGMRKELREHKRSASINKIPPKAKSPLDYLKMAKG